MKNNLIQMKRKYINLVSKLTVIAVVFSISSCREKDGVAPEYMPDMYRSPSVETYVYYGELRGKQGNDSIRNRMSAGLPVEGTIARGFMPYPYENSIEGYEAAGVNLKSPFPSSDETVKEGKNLYGMFCIQCHGSTGQGDGILVQREKFPPLPIKFNDTLDLSVGKMFHTITYGKGIMGSHASQLKKVERWNIIHYIKSSFMEAGPNTSVIDSVNVVNTNEEVAVVTETE
jgi:mono/diheme cytochrome c family protein